MLDLHSLERFRRSTVFTVGIEEELLLVEPRSCELAHRTSGRIVRAGGWTAGSAATEICDSVLELISPAAGDAAAAAGAIAALRSEAVRVGATLMGAGLHPAAPDGEVSHTRGRRYDGIVEELRGLIGRTPHCGIHVHVGMPDGESAIVACNGLRKWVPMLIALSANSPFWHGRDSGLASARTVIARSLPRSGIPRRFTDYEDYVSCVRAIGAAGQLGDYTRLWWDVRPQPRLGTIEVRALDAQHDLRTVAGLAALVHGLALHELDTRSGDDPPPEALEECCFRALRDGDRAFLQFEGRMQPLSRIATQACERARDRLPDPAALEEIQRVLCDGNGARGQRRAFVRAGMPGLVRWLVRATTARAAALRAMPPEPDSTRSEAVSA